MGKKIKIGIVGCGGIATNKHLPVIKELGDICEIVAVCDILPQRTAKFAADCGAPDVKTFEDYRDLTALPEVDAVYVLTSNTAHCEIAVDALKQGKHVMCEKPMAASTADAEKMVAAWKESGKKFTIGYQNRFCREAQMLKKSCEDGELGEIYFAKAHAIRRRAVPTWGVFANKALQGGGPLIDIGTHALDLTLWMMDNYEPASVTGNVFYKLGGMPQAVGGNLFGPWDPETYEVEDSAFGMIKMRNGAAIYLEASWALNILESREAAATLCGTKAGAEMAASSDLVYNRSHNGMLVEERPSLKGQVAFFGPGNRKPDFLEGKQFLEAVINDTEPLVHPEQALVVTKILDGIYQSAKLGKEIVWQ